MVSGEFEVVAVGTHWHPGLEYPRITLRFVSNSKGIPNERICLLVFDQPPLPAMPAYIVLRSYAKATCTPSTSTPWMPTSWPLSCKKHVGNQHPFT